MCINIKSKTSKRKRRGYVQNVQTRQPISCEIRNYLLPGIGHREFCYVPTQQLFPRDVIFAASRRSKISLATGGTRYEGRNVKNSRWFLTFHSCRILMTALQPQKSGCGSEPLGRRPKGKANAKINLAFRSPELNSFRPTMQINLHCLRLIGILH